MSDKMIYKKFYFENYKGIKKTEILLNCDDNKLHCVVGINESGKTTILKAIETTYFLLTQNEEKITEIWDKLTTKIFPKISNFTGEIIFGVVLQLSKNDKTKLRITNDEIEIKFSYNVAQGIKQINVYEEDKNDNNKLIPTNKPKTEIITNFSKQKKQFVIEYLKNNSPKIWLYDNFLEKIPDAIIFYRRGKLQTQDDIYNNDVNQKWIKLLDDVGRNSGIEGFTTFQKQIIDWKIDNPNNNNDENILSDINDKINENITQKWTEFYGKKTIQSIELKVSNVDDTIGKYKVQIVVKGIDGKPYEMEQRSLGFRWYFSFLFFTIFRKSDDALFLIDEPASNLYSVAQEGILKRLKDLSKENQIIYTTHSPYLLDNDSGLIGFLAINNDTEKQNVKSDVRIVPLKDIDINATEWLEYTKTLQDYNTLKMSKLYLLLENNLFVEGFEDWIVLSVFCRAMLNKLQDIAIIYGNGSGSMDNEIKYAICYRKKFLVMLDKDKGGKDGKKHYKDNFKWFNFENKLTNLSEFLNQQNELNIRIQDLINEEDKKKICKLCGVEYNEKSKILIINCCKNIYNQFYFDKNNEITEQLNQQLSQQTKDNFTKLADAIEKHFKLK